jgi:hypothetical protein
MMLNTITTGISFLMRLLCDFKIHPSEGEREKLNKMRRKERERKNRANCVEFTWQRGSSNSSGGWKEVIEIEREV